MTGGDVAEVERRSAAAADVAHAAEDVRGGRALALARGLVGEARGDEGARQVPLLAHRMGSSSHHGAETRLARYRRPALES